MWYLSIMSRSKHSNLYLGTVQKIYATPRGIGSKIRPKQDLPFHQPSLVPPDLLREQILQQQQQEKLQDGQFAESVHKNPSILIMPTTGGRKGRGQSAKRSGSPKRVSFPMQGGAAGTLGGPINLPQGQGGGTLGGGAPVMHFDHSSTVAFTRAVRKRFIHQPSVYKRFVRILSDIQTDHTDKLLIIQSVIELFDGQPDLIAQFNSFLPDGYSLEIQADAVVVKIYESTGQSMEYVETGHSRVYDEDISPRLATSPDTVAYIRSVREIYRRRSRAYRSFIQLLQDYHSKQVDELDTIQRVVSLFQKRPDLVLGFNKFLPPGFTIHMYDKSGYVIEFPKRKDDPEAGKDKFTILLDSKFVHQRKR